MAESEIPVTVPKEDFKDEDNLVSCECGNYCHTEYMVFGDNGNACPACYQDWIISVKDIFRELLVELADPVLSRKNIIDRIKAEFCKKFHVDEFEHLGFDDDYFDDFL